MENRLPRSENLSYKNFALGWQCSAYQVSNKVAGRVTPRSERARDMNDDQKLAASKKEMNTLGES